MAIQQTRQGSLCFKIPFIRPLPKPLIKDPAETGRDIVTPKMQFYLGSLFFRNRYPPGRLGQPAIIVNPRFCAFNQRLKCILTPGKSSHVRRMMGFISLGKNGQVEGPFFAVSYPTLIVQRRLCSQPWTSPPRPSRLQGWSSRVESPSAFRRNHIGRR